MLIFVCVSVVHSVCVCVHVKWAAGEYFWLVNECEWLQVFQDLIGYSHWFTSMQRYSVLKCFWAPPPLTNQRSNLVSHICHSERAPWDTTGFDHIFCHSVSIWHVAWFPKVSYCSLNFQNTILLKLVKEKKSWLMSFSAFLLPVERITDFQN